MKSLVQWFVTDSAEFSCSRNELPVFNYLFFERTDLFARRSSEQFDVEEFLHAEITLREQTSTETNKCLLNTKICIINIEA